ncbi:ZYRO0F16192p [Zygosaccharomyces rouxii]|uniref:Ubiquinone biosynthesis monooxygenase COQ6, mitochondrial n=1 Tax=Zygosaccharomyces rouxii (strain ATCC 2623 / CBS 732 / NBRC 1130 / NCYC 568 / NRRL Y-229) TaxID=559307 RepID=C5DYW1_ZYGRC|nr:uncharacterized protein ZYRO0F16192g [Zygosaccharomyces rouxii]KAH9201316.1 hypothetical protein LQ764DRAFT_78014 [Zygosaccharomyces rouxii]CAR28972.1 ZYRO0F16192p [Zygosaccharomyces rouxii]
MLARSAIVRKYALRKLASTATATPKLTDVLIVGGGPAGLTLAAALKSTPRLQHLKTTLVDASDLMGKVAPFYDSPPENFTNRVVSLTPPSKSFIETKAGARMLEDRIQPYDGMYVTDGLTNATLNMEKDSMAYMVEILNIQSSLLKRLEELNLPSESLQLMDNTKVASIEYSDPEDTTSWPIVTLDNGEVFKTRLLVGADGFNSPVRKFSDIQSRGWFYNRFGVVATMKLEYPPYKLRGWQRFLPTGPIAHLALPDDNATLVWSTTEPLSRLLREITPEQFTGLVNAAFVLEDSDLKYFYRQLEKGTISNEKLLEDINFRTEQVYDSLENDDLIDEIYPPRVKSILGPSRARFPLKMFHADTYCKDRIALVGDAAHATHPLAGQGLNMGQGDVEALIKALEKASMRGHDIGSLLSLQPFWAERYPINNMLLGMTDKLHKIYGTDFAPIVALRSLGVSIMNKVGPLKNLISGTLSDSGK